MKAKIAFGIVLATSVFCSSCSPSKETKQANRRQPAQGNAEVTSAIQAEGQAAMTIFVTGQAHAALYPCDCPANPVGGVLRRATAIKEILRNDPDALLIEAGGIFAGGKFDGATQTADFDKNRTEFYLQSLVAMDYDALIVSSEEFNFDEEFLNQMQSRYALPYVSANVNGDFLPSVIRKIRGITVAVIGITDPGVTNKTKIAYTQSGEALAAAVKDARENKKADIIVVASYIDKEKSLELLKEVTGIDVFVSSQNPFRGASSEKVGATTLVIPAWEAREATELKLTVSKGKLLDVSVSAVNLAKNVIDDEALSKLIPACFSDRNCKKDGYAGKCENGGALNAACTFSEVKPVELTVIQPKECKTCDVNATLERIKQIFPNIKATSINETDKQAVTLIKDLEIKMLPAYILDSSVEKEPIFGQLSKIIRKSGEHYVFEPSFTGVSYFADRKKVPNRLDVFFDITTENIVEVLNVLQALEKKQPKIDVNINFLAIEDPKAGFITKGGKYELEEFLRIACVAKYYPAQIWHYLSCRLADIESSWWDDCLLKFKMDPTTIKACAQTQEEKTLLRDFIRLTQELEVVFGPTYVINNQEIFSSQGVPKAGELEELFR